MVYGPIAMTAMLLIGIWTILRVFLHIFARLEVLVVLFIMFVWALQLMISYSFGEYSRAKWSIPISLIAGVGIINAINLIDGVNGYSSGFALWLVSFSE